MAVDPRLTELAGAVAAALVPRRQTLAVAESAAGGLISASLLSVPGASAFYLGGAVIYTLVASRGLLSGAIPEPAGMQGATEAFARYHATAVAKKLGADWGLAETGATGPSPNPYGDPPGHAWVAVAGPGVPARGEHVLTGLARREENMTAFAAAALTLLLRRLSG